MKQQKPAFVNPFRNIYFEFVFAPGGGSPRSCSFHDTLRLESPWPEPGAERGSERAGEVERRGLPPAWECPAAPGQSRHSCPRQPGFPKPTARPTCGSTLRNAVKSYCINNFQVSRQKLATLFRRPRAEKVVLRAAPGECLILMERAAPSWRSWRLCVRSFLESVDDTGDAAFDRDHVAVHEQPQTLVSQLQIGEKLLLVHGRDGLFRRRASPLAMGAAVAASIAL